MTYIRILAALTAIAVVVLISTSGGSENGGELAAVPSPLHGAKHPPTAASGYIVKSSDPVYNGKAPRVLSFPTGRDTDEISETGAVPVNPCSLVPHGRAAAILGGPVRVSRELQGPTCVYAARRSQREVTLVVTEARLAGLRKHARRASRIQVAGHSAWCLHYESASVAVPLSHGRVLHVSGPCAAAESFAERALPRLSH